MPNLITTLGGAGTFREFIMAASRAKLLYLLESETPFTLIVPVDRAFAQIPESIRLTMTNDFSKMKELVAYHIIPGCWTLGAIARRGFLKTLRGARLPVSINNGVYLYGARVLKSDWTATNGIIHIVDRVILTPELLAVPSPASLN